MHVANIPGELTWSKKHISDIWRLCNYHTGGWFDTEDKRELDQRHRNILLQIEQDVNKLISLYKSYDIKES